MWFGIKQTEGEKTSKKCNHYHSFRLRNKIKVNFPCSENDILLADEDPNISLNPAIMISITVATNYELIICALLEFHSNDNT